MVVPALFPVTTPVLLTVAMLVLEDIQGLEAAGVPEPVNVIVPSSQTVVGPVMVGCAVTVIVIVLAHPLLFVKVITVVPGFTPVTTPVFDTVATPVLEEVQGLVAAGVPEPVSVIVEFLQTDVGPEIVGCPFTVIVIVLEQPVLFVYVIIAVPAFTPVTIPAFDTVATPVLEDVHGLVAAGVPEPVKVIVDVLHTAVGPEIVGCAVTVIATVFEQPLLLVYVMTVVPGFTAVITPALDTVATLVVEDVHGVVAAGVPDPVKVIVEPSQTVVGPLIVG